MTTPEYFEFIYDFSVTFWKVLELESRVLIRASVARIVQETQSQVKCDNYSLIVQKCLNILKQITNKKELVVQYYGEVEQCLLPLFEFMTDPSKISFAEDIMVILKNLIKKTQSVSENAMKLFFTLEKLFNKNNC